MHFDSVSNLVTPKYHQIWISGLDFEGPLLRNILRGELVYISTEDKSGKDSAIKIPTLNI